MHLVRRVGGRVKRRGARAAALVRRTVAPPLREGTSPLLLHCCHHKVGTVWFTRVLRAVGAHYALPFEHLPGEGELPKPGTRLALQHHARIDLADFGPLVGSHMVRDPRDVVVSGFYYHLWTKEPAIVQPDPDLDGRSYQDHLRSLGRKEGLLAEMERASSRAIAEMVKWDYEDPRFLELRYEDAITDEASTFQALFHHYGFSERAVERCVEIAAGFSFQRVAARPTGEVQERSHLRSGSIGQWRDEFDADHVERFKELAGDALIRLGYETDLRW